MKKLFLVTVVLFLTVTVASAEIKVGDWVETTPEYVAQYFDFKYFRGVVFKKEKETVWVDSGCKEEILNKYWLRRYKNYTNYTFFSPGRLATTTSSISSSCCEYPQCGCGSYKCPTTTTTTTSYKLLCNIKYFTNKKGAVIHSFQDRNKCVENHMFLVDPDTFITTTTTVKCGCQYSCIGVPVGNHCDANCRKCTCGQNCCKQETTTRTVKNPGGGRIIFNPTDTFWRFRHPTTTTITVKCGCTRICVNSKTFEPECCKCICDENCCEPESKIRIEIHSKHNRTYHTKYILSQEQKEDLKRLLGVSNMFNRNYKYEYNIFKGEAFSWKEIEPQILEILKK